MATVNNLVAAPSVPAILANDPDRSRYHPALRQRLPETFPPPSVPPFTIGQGTAIVLDRPLLESVGNGQCFGIYLLRDKAGNVSRLSWWVTATVALAAAARGA